MVGLYGEKKYKREEIRFHYSAIVSPLPFGKFAASASFAVGSGVEFATSPVLNAAAFFATSSSPSVVPTFGASTKEGEGRKREKRWRRKKKGVGGKKEMGGGGTVSHLCARAMLLRGCVWCADTTMGKYGTTER